MTTTREYKGYIGSVESDMDRLVNRGKILFINDLVTYEAADLKQLQAEFEAAVDDYLETCIELGRQVQKPMSGVFNVRVEPEVHQAMAMLAARRGQTLNGMVGIALKACIAKANLCTADVEVLHTHRHVVINSGDESTSGLVVTTAGAQQTWLN